jgi:hypothetical protein
MQVAKSEKESQMINTPIKKDELEPLLDKIISKEKRVRWPALEQLKLQVGSISEEDRERVLTVLESNLKAYDDYYAYDMILEIGGIKRFTQITATQPNLGWYLITKESLLEQLWKDDPERIIHLLIPVLDDKDLAATVIGWLSDKAEDIPPATYNAVIAALQSKKIDKTPEIKLKKETALTRIKRFSSMILQKPLFDSLDKETDVDLQIGAVQELLELESRQVTRDLVNRWCEWAVSGDRPILTETIPEYLRMSTQAVLPLVENLSRKPELRNSLRRSILDQVLPNRQIDLVEVVFSDLRERGPRPDMGKEYYQLETGNFLDSLAEGSDTFKKLRTQADLEQWDWTKIVEKATELLLVEKLALREEQLQQRILKQIADMSEKRYFDNDEPRYQEILKELGKHAVPEVAARLPKEANVNRRESMARLLSNMGRQEAKDALVLAVVGEERIRTERQELLAKYYLDPSKQRSEEAAQLLSQAVDDARQTLRVLRWLNITVFSVGVLLLLFGTMTAIYGSELSTRVVGVLAGLGGLSGILYEMIKSPLDRIQNAMADLVEIETAFTSFIWELNLNGTFIQSQYVAAGILNEYQISQTVKRIEDAMTLAMNQVSVHTKVGQQRVISRIYDLKPAAGSAGGKVVVYGQHLLGDKTEKKVDTGILAINHKPIKAEDLKWKDQEVSFTLPQKNNGNENMNETIWISLLVDGMETNALPFHVL